MALNGECLYTERINTEYRYAECLVFTVFLSVILLNVDILNVIILSVTLFIVKVSVGTLNVVMPSAVVQTISANVKLG